MVKIALLLFIGSNMGKALIRCYPNRICLQKGFQFRFLVHLLKFLPLRYKICTTAIPKGPLNNFIV